jgi:cell division protein YceG involved in septum cleavage
MTEDWFPGDPFADPDDPAAAERERRRQEREERRKTRREGKREEEQQAVPELPPEPSPPQEPRTPEEEFWDEPAAEEPPPVAASPPPPPRPPGSGPFAAIRRHPFRALAVVIAIAAAFAVGVLYRHFHRSAAPAPAVERTVTVTIPEGYSRAQTAPLAKKDGLRGSYEAASVHSKYLDPAHYGGKGAKNLEGFLFPDTFELKRHAPVSDLVQLQLEDFKRRIKGVDMGYARSKNLTTYDVVTIASMIEREAQVASERKLVAAVIYNRLHDGMPLGIDATIRFATGNYTRPLTESQLATPSPYNTRTNQGLPPGPIDSPGLASLEAAARPAKVSYLFYVVKPGTCGQLAFSSTEAQFQRNVERYNSAREAAGGNSPTTCGQ